MKLKKIILLLSLSVLSATSASQGGRDFKPFEPAKIATTGIQACDSYFAQIEACMKQQVPASQYHDLEVGLTGLKQEILYLDDAEYAAKSCNEAREEAKKVYAGKGCTFY